MQPLACLATQPRVHSTAHRHTASSAEREFVQHHIKVRRRKIREMKNYTLHSLLTKSSTGSCLSG
ncbi:hypothetical protein E2C01_018432 [Portunus trituberculatus]|uniref:Uncharacterized protein n=1 Tax=Portunus trituberculatus TaxID=210409 RepID=A0A5B7DWF9_PORTR|nr:hypothetical protein [Portunus trituberculatus]